ncbi:MAG: hypothetical protein ABSH38_21250 [Verrucomicrobiota bacterium]
MGGTSAAAPLWAAFTALVNQQTFSQGQPPIGFANPPLYALARGPQSSAIFNDITTGNNTNLLSADEFFAVPGYDLCTGWGSPAGGNLIAALAQNPQFDLTLLNGGFETATFADWTVNAPGGAMIVGAGSRTFRPYVHSGTYAAYLSQAGTLGYLSQYATNLGAPSWQNLGPPITATNALMTQSDLRPPDQQRFYRVILLP